MLAALVAGCSHLGKGEYLDARHAPVEPGWMPLCNGRDLTGWKSLTPDRPMSWKVEDGVMINDPAGKHGVNIYTEETFDDFEIYYEYQIAENGNSGVFLRGLYEIQIIDDYGRPSDKPKDWGNGGLWGTQAPSHNFSKPAGQWQSVYARLFGNCVTVFLNGHKVIDAYKLTKPTHKYKQLDLEHGDPGPILLQGDHKPVRYRHVMIRPLKGCCKHACKHRK
jgi:hypothetical protein